MASPSSSETLIDAIVISYHRLTLAAERLHADSGLTTGMRSVLLTLERTGPQSSARLAASRSVSRQFMQKLTAAMVDADWLEREQDPADRRLVILHTTAKARRALARLKRVEGPLLKQLETRLGRTDIARAAEILGRLCDLVGDHLAGNAD